jgi:hypothetical protein
MAELWDNEDVCEIEYAVRRVGCVVACVTSTNAATGLHVNLHAAQLGNSLQSTNGMAIGSGLFCISCS